MSQVTPINQIPGTEHPHSLLNRIFGITQQLNGGLDFGLPSQTPGNYTGNMNGQWAMITAPVTPNTEFAIPHSLGRVPSMYLYNIDRAGILYQLAASGTLWTSSNIYVKCSVASAILNVWVS